MLCDELFLHVINQSLINLHYYIKDKDAYNIKEYNKKLGTVSYNKMKEEISYYQDILDKLADDKSLQYDRLSKDQKLTRDTIE